MTIYLNLQCYKRLLSGLTAHGKSDLILTYLDTLQQPFENFNLSEGSRRIRDLPNAGGNSMFSEVLSYELLYRLLPDLNLFATEMEVRYFPRGGPMTDYLVSLNASHQNQGLHPTIGVSVTRAFAFRRQFTKSDALRILRKKLLGVIKSTRTVIGCELKKQLLHIWAPTGSVARLVRRIFWGLEDEVRSNTFVIVTVVNSDWVFTSGSTGHPTTLTKKRAHSRDHDTLERRDDTKNRPWDRRYAFKNSFRKWVFPSNFQLF
ncbi:hypothetical protein K7432_006738 [Basidiobolus ranarum]|uniref:Uncharacterized protein n=1 Tax=Basidiobolus ranarum TaxID=34480 RepID=A0ABR2WUS6_9FUNG